MLDKYGWAELSFWILYLSLGQVSKMTMPQVLPILPEGSVRKRTTS